MPQIVVTAGAGTQRRAGREVMRERVMPSDLESELFVSHLVERIEWALSDADTIECRERQEAEERDGEPKDRDSGGRLV